MKALVFLFGILISSASYANLFAQSESDNSFFSVESRLKVESDTQFGASELLETGRFSETDTSSQTSGSKKSEKIKETIKVSGNEYFGRVSNENTQSTNPETINGIYIKHGQKTCFDEAGIYHGVDPWILYSIASVESNFNPKAVNGNTDKSVDFGMMQINSYWYPKLLKKGITKKMLADPCVSTYVGAWILRQNMDQYGNSWKAIGAYNAVSTHKQIIYYNKVRKAHSLLTAEARRKVQKAQQK